MIRPLAVASVIWLVWCSNGVSQEQQGSDHQFCKKYQNEWTALSVNGSVDRMRQLGDDPQLARMCPRLDAQIRDGISNRLQREAEAEEREARLREAAAQKDANAQRELTNLRAELTRQRQATIRAENTAATERNARLAREAAEQVPGRVRTLLACAISQDVERLDQGNIPNVRFENLRIPPEVQVVYDIADASSGAVDVYGWSFRERQWSRDRIGASRTGDQIAIGSTQENDANIRFRQNFVIDLATMTVRGKGFAEPAALNNGSAVNLDLGTGRWSLDAAKLTQRPPKLWIEARGNCAYQSGGPPGPLTATPEFRVTSRDIPTIPPVPRR